MPSIGSIFAEQLKRCKDRLSWDRESDYERLLRTSGKQIHKLITTAIILRDENARLRSELQTLAKDYEKLRDSIKAEIFDLAKKETGDGEEEIAGGEAGRTDRPA